MQKFMGGVSDLVWSLGLFFVGAVFAHSSHNTNEGKRLSPTIRHARSCPPLLALVGVVF